MERILVVDDDRSTRHLIRLQLRGAGYTVETAADGAAALDHVRRKKFDLVLLDVWMPGMDGLEVLARLRDEPSQPKVVVMTADENSETFLRAIQGHAYRYVTKPVEPKQLLELYLPLQPINLQIRLIRRMPWVTLPTAYGFLLV